MKVIQGFENGPKFIETFIYIITVKDIAPSHSLKGLFEASHALHTLGSFKLDFVHDSFSRDEGGEDKEMITYVLDDDPGWNMAGFCVSDDMINEWLFILVYSSSLLDDLDKSIVMYGIKVGFWEGRDDMMKEVDVGIGKDEWFMVGVG